MTILTRLILGALLCAPLSHAVAHVGAGAGDTDLLPQPGNPGAVRLEAPWGLVVSTDGEAYDWVCHEVLSNGVAELPEFEVSRDGVLLGVTGLLTGVVVPDESLYRSEDGGCSWSAVGGTTGRLIQDAAFDPANGALVLAVTSDPLVDGVPIRNGVFRSTDGGETFVETASFDGLAFQSVVFGAEDVAYALAVREEPLEAVLLRSADGGLNWVERVVPDESLETPAFGVISSVDPLDPNEVWLSFEANAVDGVLATTDGGDSFEVKTVPPVLVLDLTLTADGGAWLVGDARQLWRSSDRASWTLQDAAPQVWGGAEGPDGLVLAVNTLAHDEALVRTRDGVDYETMLTTLDLRGPLACPAESDVAQVCAPLWPSLRRTLELMRPSGSGDDDDDSAATEPPEGCGCASQSSGAPGAWMWGELAALLARRRRDQLPQRTSGSPPTGATIR
jgi:uncharacterized protein (TIGR03382 family)